MRKCKECGEPIPERRLQALPNATMCVPCTEAAGDVRRHSEPSYVPAYPQKHRPGQLTFVWSREELKQFERERDAERAGTNLKGEEL